MTEWSDVSRVLIGSWPQAKWSRETLAAYLAELQARGVTPDLAIGALRRSTSQFPPAVGAIAVEVAPVRRSSEEAWWLLTDAIKRVGCSHNAADFAERHQAAVDWLAEQDEVLAAYAARRGLVGPGTLGVEPVADPEFGGAVVHRLRGEIEECRKAAEVRVRAGLPAVEPRQLVVRSTGAAQGGMAGLLDRLRPAGQIEEG